MAYTTRELSARTFRDFAALAVQQGECWCIFYQRPAGRPRVVEGAAERAESKGQGGACPRRPLPCCPRLRRQDADRLVSIRETGGTPEDRRATDLPRGRRARRDGDALEDHVLLRGEEPSREGRREVRAAR